MKYFSAERIDDAVSSDALPHDLCSPVNQYKMQKNCKYVNILSVIKQCKNDENFPSRYFLMFHARWLASYFNIVVTKHVFE